MVNNIAFLGLLDFGLIPTLHRRIALTYGKLSVARTSRRLTYLNKKMRILFSTGKRLFAIRGYLTFFISVGAGYLYLQTLRLSPEVKTEVLWGWLAIAVGQAIQIRGAIWSAFLMTTGNVALETVLAMVISTIDLATRFLVVWLGGGIVELAIVAGVAIIVRRWVSGYFVRRRLPDWFSAPEPFSRTLVGSMARPMGSAWLVGVGAFLLLRTDQYFIVGTLDPKALPAYQGAYQIFFSLSQFALITSGSVGVFLSHYWAAGQYEAFRRTVLLSLRIALAILWFGIATLMAIGASFFDLWLGPGNFLGYGLMAAFALTMLVDAQQNILTNADRATEHEVYGRWLILCGVLNVVITYVMSKAFGLVGIALSTSIAMLLTTGWLSATNAQRRLGLAFVPKILPMQLTTAAAAGVVYAAIRLAVWLIGPGHLTPQAGTALGLLIGPPALGLWIWLVVFSREQRGKLLAYVKGRVPGLKRD